MESIVRKFEDYIGGQSRSFDQVSSIRRYPSVLYLGWLKKVLIFGLLFLLVACEPGNPVFNDLFDQTAIKDGDAGNGSPPNQLLPDDTSEVGGDDIILGKISSFSGHSDSFTTVVDFTGGSSLEEIVTLFYCNATDNPGCKPTDDLASGQTLSRNGNRLIAFRDSLVAGDDPGDTLNVTVVVTSAEGNVQIIKTDSLRLVSSAFVSRWTVTAGNLEVDLPLAATGANYNMTVNWGDGQTSVVTAWNDMGKKHTYAGPGTYTISITGTAEAWDFKNAGYVTQNQIVEVISFGDLGWKNLNGAFYDCANLMGFKGGDTSLVTDMTHMFKNASKVRPNLMGWDTGSVNSMLGVFSGATLANPNTEYWNTTAVTNMSYMFSNTAMAEPETKNWDTSNVVNMSYMFTNAELAKPNTGGWSVSKVTSFSNMFRNSISADPDTSQWDTGATIDFSGMFALAVVANPDTSSWDTSQALFMEQMFGGAVLANPDTSGWITANVKDMEGMFKGALSANPDTSGWQTNSVLDLSSMFDGAIVATPDTSGWSTGNVKYMYNLFSGAVSVNPDMSGWNFSKVLFIDNMFAGVTISTQAYSDYLVNVATTASAVSNKVINGGGSKHNTYAATYRVQLLVQGWTIIDAGQE